jgi:ABC-type nitrate/sulfonate/bicarbonate transport system substrate-binding protein
MRVTRSQATRIIAGGVALGSFPALVRAQTGGKIRVAMIPNEPAAMVYYAQDMGFFAKEGLDVDIAQNPSTPAIASAVVTGTYDIAYATISTLAVAHVRGLPFVMIAAGVGNLPGRPSGGIMVPVNSTASTGKDFNGKTFGAAGLNTLAEYLPRAWIDKHGGDSTTVRFVEIPFPETPDALAAGRIDASYLTEPFITIAEKKHIARFLTSGDDAIAKSYTSTAWYTTEAWAKAHPDLVARFARVMSQTARWANDNPTLVIPMLAKYLKADPVLAAEEKRPYYVDRLSLPMLQPWIDVTARYAKFAPFPAADMVYVPPR